MNTIPLELYPTCALCGWGGGARVYFRKMIVETGLADDVCLECLDRSRRRFGLPDITGDELETVLWLRLLKGKL